MHAEAKAQPSNRSLVMRRLIKTQGQCLLVAQKRSPYEAVVSAVAHHNRTRTRRIR